MHLYDLNDLLIKCYTENVGIGGKIFSITAEQSGVPELFSTA